jgi:hypothetical protein
MPAKPGTGNDRYWQIPALHMLCWQSPEDVQVWPVLHVGPHEPPQSTSVSSPCTNGVADGDETDVDCGGSCGPTCKAGQTCAFDSDCEQSACSTGGICQ